MVQEHWGVDTVVSGVWLWLWFFLYKWLWLKHYSMTLDISST